MALIARYRYIPFAFFKITVSTWNFENFKLVSTTVINPSVSEGLFIYFILFIYGFPIDE